MHVFSEEEVKEYAIGVVELRRFRYVQGSTEGEEGPAVEALRLLHDRLTAELKAAGVVRIEAKGNAFDPSKMEAITTVPATDEHPAGQVIEELEAGFMLHDRVLQASRVVVAA